MDSSGDEFQSPRASLSSVSTTSLVFEHIDEHNTLKKAAKMRGEKKMVAYADEFDGDLESAHFIPDQEAHYHRTSSRTPIILTIIAFCVFGSIALFSYMGGPIEERTRVTTGKPVTMDSWLAGDFAPKSKQITWIAGPDGQDGWLLEQGTKGQDWLVVSDVRSADVTTNGGSTKNADSQKLANGTRTLVTSDIMSWHDFKFTATKAFPNPQLTKVLVAAAVEANWRHSFNAIYFIVDVATQDVIPLIPEEPRAIVQLATWSPKGDSIAFTRSNNMFLRSLDAGAKDIITQITDDAAGGYFYGVPDWVYEEEVFSGNSATWWSDDGSYIAFLRTNDTGVMTYPLDFFVPGQDPKADKNDELYPTVQSLKYPKAGTPNPVVDLLFYSVEKGEMFSVPNAQHFPDDDRLITTVLWAGEKVLVKETNRVSDIMNVVLIDPKARTSKTVQTINVKDIDGGWFEISTDTKFVPADPANGRPEDGYIDTVIYENRDHLAYFSPMDTSKPVMLTKGDWEVVDAPSAVDLKNNLVYFVSTKESSIQRHVYSVKLDGSDLKPITEVSSEGYYDVSFSEGAGYALLSYRGPDIPWQKVISTPTNTDTYSKTIENNAALAERTKATDLPTQIFGTFTIEGVTVNYVERRPANFDPSKRYPVLFQQYSGPGSQSVSKRFAVNFQSYVTSSLGYITVTVDGRGTGFIGRKARVCVRGQLGLIEAQDQITAAKRWAALPYIDEERLAIWGWSYGGFNTLKTLEADAGRTFKYGMAVAPVTDWRYYDSIYTERYMLTPQTNPDGYAQSAVHNASALGENVRFLVMHGTGDDNVHIQNTYTLLDKLNVQGVENYDVQVFPDSNHGIYFHNGYRIIHDKLSNWLVNAFNGEWLKTQEAVPRPEKREIAV